MFTLAQTELDYLKDYARSALHIVLKKLKVTRTRCFCYCRNNLNVTSSHE